MLEELKRLNKELRAALESENWAQISELQNTVQPLLGEIKVADKLSHPEFLAQLNRLQELYEELIASCKDRRDYFKGLSNKTNYQNAVAKAYSNGNKVV